MKHPLTASQLAIYYESVNKAGLPVYIIPVMLKLEGGVALDRLATAVDTVVARYPVLSMTIAKDDDGMPHLTASGGPCVKCVVENMADAAFEALRSRLPEPMDLDGGRLFEARIFSTPGGAYLYLPFHHIVGDGSTLRVVIDDIVAAYKGDNLPDVEMTIFDVQAAEEEKRRSPRHDEARQWHIDTFGTSDSESIPLADRLEAVERDSSQLLATVRQKVVVLGVDYDKVFALSRTLHVPMSILLDGAFGYLAGIWNASDESSFCTIFAGRTTPQEKRVAGMMVKTVPVYCHWADDTTVADYLQGLAKQHSTAKSYADAYSFADFCADTGFAPRLNFSYRGSIQAENTVIPGFCTASSRLGYHTTGDTLLFMVDHIDGHLAVKAEYQGTDYTPEFIESMIDAYDMVLRGFLGKERLCEIELCSPAMIQRLEAFNATSPEADLQPNFVEAFTTHAKNAPDSLILTTGDERLTYGDALATATALATHLNTLGIGKGDVVAVLVGRNRHMVTATLGVLCSGAAYEPLDASYPATRLNYMMRDAGVKLLIKDRDIPFELDDELRQQVSILYTDEIGALPQPQAYTTPEGIDDAPFIILYTSGTTGLPKGVALTHRNLAAFCGQCNRNLGMAPGDVFAMYASYGFDAGFFSILCPIAAGADVAVVPEDVRFDIDALNNFFVGNHVTHAFMTTQVGRIFATSVDHTSLRSLMVGGEKLVPCAPPKNFSLFNFYGPTEGTVYCHGKLVDKLYTRVPVGLHTDDYKNYIVDRHGRRMPLGALGEMLIAGPQVGAGYLNLPEKTASVFARNPFSHDPLYANLYHTGDIVRLLPANGEADIIGRNDGQVKIRGFRIELTEVEQIVRDFPGISDATVQAFDSPSGGKFIAAYIVAGHKVDIAALNAFIAEHKPPYMVPEVTMQIDAIPLTQNQKVNKRALPQPQPAQQAATEEKRTPNLLEKIICEIVGNVLNQSEIPLTLPLSQSGLTSISSIRLASALYKRFGINFKGADLVKGATVVTIEDAVIEHLLASGADTGQPLQEKPATHTCHLTVSQQGVYADTMRTPGSTAYNIPICFTFVPETDPEALAGMVRKVIDAHPYLRDMHLCLGETDVEQTVVPHITTELPVKRMSAADFELYSRDFVRPFDLMAAPLYRIEVVATPQGVHLLMDVQHIAFDGSSLTIMLGQLKTLVEGGSIKPEEYTYLDYARTERQWLEGDEGSRAAAFFRDMLADCEAASDIPSDLPQSQTPGERGIIARAVDFAKAERFCRERGITPAALYLAATCYATARFTMSRSAYISTISSGRGDVRFGDTVGMFVKTLPIAMTIGDGSAIEYAQTAGTRLASVVENETYPYARICADYNYAPNIVYEYQHGLVDDLTIGGHKVERRLLEADTLKFKIAVHIEEVDGSPSVAVHYRRGIYSDALMQTYCDAIAAVAGSIIAAPDAPIRRLTMLSDVQRDLVERLSHTAIVPPSAHCFHNLMEQQAALHPNRKAIVAADRTLTYAELDRTANIVANNLMARGVKKGDKVVILLSRTSRFFTSLYGVLKAGAAYIPSSPDYPDERKRSIIDDSQAAFVITDDNVEALHCGHNDSRPDVSVGPDDLVYLIYTSGSTGKPKGVLLRHRGIVNYVTPEPAMLHTHAIVGRCTTVGSITTVAFDMALKEWGIALSNGLTLVFASDEQSNDPVALAELFIANGVDYFNTTPSRMQQYMELERFCDMLRGCRVVICGAEKYPENLLQRIRTVATGAEIFNTYGPTEITVSSNAAHLTSATAVTVGRPLRGYIEHIVDLDDNLLPPGVIGELLIGGNNIAAGYNANPEQTAKAFIRFQGVSTYRSGDYARWDADGNVVILGRKDTQVKLRGLRIELGEIERVMGDIAGIGASHIMIRNVGGRENLVAYYVVKPGAALTADDVKARMAERLTDYMLPSFFVEMQQMPLTPNGKINARELPEPETAQRQAGRPAANATEQLFVDTFKEVLGTGTVYADDNFFALGGTSLTATRIMIAAAKAGHRIVYADIFANPTPEALARLIAPEAAPAADVHTPSTFPDIADYDYTAIDSLLAQNTLDTFRSGERLPLGTVMLTGATGFAGMHVLHELLSRYDCHIVCLGRDSRTGVPAAERIEQLYFYYIGQPMADRYPGRVTVVKGDITRIDGTFDPGMKVDTVINCAANVKHFSAGTDIEDINYHGVLNLIAWCRAHGARLVQTSTVSVTGRQSADSDALLTEQSLYIGQNLGDNKYITSKFMAERAVLEAHAKGEIVGKVVRLGNLAPRNRDGEFQINFSTNGFMNRLKSINLVGCYPYGMYAQNKDISPIDDVARAIVLFAQTPTGCVMFHGNNANRYSLGNFYYEASLAGLDIHPVETEEFAAALDEAKKDPAKLNALVGLMAYEGMGAGLKPVDYANDYSAQVLLRMGFHWPVISSGYVGRLVKQLDGLGFFLTL